MSLEPKKKADFLRRLKAALGRNLDYLRLVQEWEEESAKAKGEVK